MKKRRSWKIRLTHAEVEARAAQAYRGHAVLIAEGFRLADSSAFWSTTNGTITARLVYRHDRPAERAIDAIAITVRGLRPEPLTE